tara:strand:- start:863 stop:1033 length:171 start_codon:yes stop_codon:yes gene_type:complete
MKIEKITLWTALETYSNEQHSTATALDLIVPALEATGLILIDHDSEDHKLVKVEEK